MHISPLVLVTGSAGRIGQAVVRELKSRTYSVRGFDLVPTPYADQSIVGDLADLDSVRKACAGTKTIIHLAATPDDDDFMTRLLPSNIVGVYNILESARRAEVRRVVLASSGQVVWWQRRRGPWPIGVAAAPSPRGWYAAAKVFLEAAGRVYAESHAMSVIAVRLGWCPRTPEQARELSHELWAQNVYLSPGDAGRFFACCVEAPADVRFSLVYACSKPIRALVYDPEPARLLGYLAQDTYPEGLEEFQPND